MSVSSVPTDHEISIPSLIENPYAIYRRLREESPVLAVESVGRILLTKAADTRYVKDNPELFSSDDPNTPMEKAFEAKTLMRRDGADHLRLRQAMMPSFSAKNIRDIWVPLYEKIADDYIGRLPRDETVDLFSALAGPVSARCLAELMGIQEASDAEMQRWSQALIDGAGNFGWLDEPFAAVALANQEMNACFGVARERLLHEPDQSAMSVQIHADNPIEYEHIVSNIKIAIGGGINEPRDSLLTAVCGLLTNPDQKQMVLESGSMWEAVFEEAIRWVAPIQVSSRRVLEDTVIRDCQIEKGQVVMTVQASANHDEELVENGELFNVLRGKVRHQAFGNGPHFCMGMHVARRLVADILLPRLFDRFPGLLLPDPQKVVWSGFGFRGPIQMPVTLKT